VKIEFQDLSKGGTKITLMACGNPECEAVFSMLGHHDQLTIQREAFFGYRWRIDPQRNVLVCPTCAAQRPTRGPDA
jgi:hypothetical protein